MTKMEADLAGTLGIAVVRVASERDTGTRERYRILALSKEYPEQYERERGKKAEQTVTLVDSMRRCVKTKLELIELAHPAEFAAIQEAYLADKKPEKKEEPEPDAPKTEPKKKAEPFRKPTADEVAAYAGEMQLDVDAQAFVDHYAACGWVVGRNKPMKDWRAAVRNWVRRDGEFSSEKRIPAEEAVPEKQSSFETDAFFMAALAKSYGEVGQ